MSSIKFLKLTVGQLNIMQNMPRSLTNARGWFFGRNILVRFNPPFAYRPAACAKALYFLEKGSAIYHRDKNELVAELGEGREFDAVMTEPDIEHVWEACEECREEPIIREFFNEDVENILRS